MNRTFLGFFAVIALAFCEALTACNGGNATSPVGGGGGGTTTYYTVTATAGTGTTITPPSTTVTAGSSVSFTVGLLSGYQNLVATGCTLSLSATTCTVAEVNSNMSVTVTATAIPPVTHTITVLVPYGLSVTSSSLTVNDGSAFSVTATAATGYAVTGATPTGVTGTFSGATFTSNAVTSNGSVQFVGDSVGDGYRLNWIKVSPQVLAVSKFSTTPVTVQISTYGSKVAKADINPFTVAFNGSTVSTHVSMVDGGTIGGEHLFSVTFPTGITPPSTLGYYGNTVDALTYFVNAYDSSSNMLSDTGGSTGETSTVIDPQFQLGVVADSIVNATTLSQVDTSVFSTPNVVNVVEPTCLVDAVTQASATLAKYYPDVFQSVVSIASGCTRGMNGPRGGVVNNQVSGIGLTVGSSPTSMLSSEAWMTMDDILLTFLPHEAVGHGMGMFHLNLSTLKLSDSVGAHISPMASLTGVTQYGQSIAQQPDGNWKIVGVSNGVQPSCRHFTPLELYLAGFGKDTDVPNFYIAPNSYMGTLSEIPASAVSQVSISQIESVYGQRNPTYSNTLKNLQFGFVVVSPVQATVAEMAFYNTIASYYAGTTGDTVVTNYGGCTPPALSVALSGKVSVSTTLPAHK